MNIRNELSGYWSLDKSPLKLGAVCTFISNLQSYAQIKECDNITVSFISHDEYPDGLSYEEAKDTWMSILFTSLDISKIETYKSYYEFIQAKLVVKEGTKIFPSPFLAASVGLLGDWYDTTRLTQYLYSEHGAVPSLDLNANHLLAESGNFVTLHLKNATDGDIESNAQMSVWKEFLSNYRDSGIQFLLIGKDAVPSDILNMPHVASLEELGVPFVDQLSHIQKSLAFMGMVSGPSNVAILSDIPYLIFKHPDHHTEIMQREMGDETSFNFSRRNQSLMRETETVAQLTAFMDKVIRDVRL